MYKIEFVGLKRQVMRQAASTSMRVSDDKNRATYKLPWTHSMRRATDGSSTWRGICTSTRSKPTFQENHKYEKKSGCDVFTHESAFWKSMCSVNNPVSELYEGVSNSFDHRRSSRRTAVPRSKHRVGGFPSKSAKLCVSATLTIKAWSKAHLPIIPGNS